MSSSKLEREEEISAEEEKEEESTDVRNNHSAAAVSSSEPNSLQLPETLHDDTVANVERSTSEIIPANSRSPATAPGAVSVLSSEADVHERTNLPAQKIEHDASTSTSTNRQFSETSMSRTDSKGNYNVPSGASLQPGAVAVAGAERLQSGGEPDGDEQSLFCSPTVALLPNDDQENHSTDNQKRTSIVDNEGDSASPVIEAELVTAPIEALHVAIDEESTLFTQTQAHPFEMEHAPSSHNHSSDHRKRYSPNFFLLLALFGIIVLCAISIPLTLSRRADSEAAAAPRFPYPCYTSTWKILEAQLSDQPTPEAYILCPGTKIQIGTFRNPALDDYAIVRGDYPITAIRENVTIQCGIDGKQENNCILHGGFMQVLTIQTIPLPEDQEEKLFFDPIDNFEIRGITFTGILENTGPFKGQSVALSQPGKNIRFKDCLWVDIAVEALISVHRNYFQIVFGLDLDPLSIEVTFEDCTFKDIVHSLPLLMVISQIVTFRRCRFQYISPSVLVYDTCSLGGIYEADRDIYFREGCASLLYADINAVIELEDLCLEGVDTFAPGLIVVHPETDIVHSGLFLDSAIDTECEEAIIFDYDTTNTTCVQIFDALTCPISSE